MESKKKASKTVKVQPLSKKYTSITIKGIRTNLIDFV